MDVLSDVLRAVRITGAVFFDIDTGSPWSGEQPGTAAIAHRAIADAEHVISFHAILSGSCRVTPGNGQDPPVKIHTGDVVVFPGGDPRVAQGKPDGLPFTLLDGDGGGDGPERTRLVCGYLGCDARPFNPLLAALPAMMCVRKPEDGTDWVTDLLQRALAEGSHARAGGETVLARLSELMFVEIVRRHIESLPAGSHGWLSGLRDPHIGEALRLIHACPTNPWTVERLAREVGQSRTVFAERFTDCVEVPPMQYLVRWRLQLAARHLEQPGMSIAQAGAEVGYESEAAFSRAFKKFAGIPPGLWRKRHQTPRSLPQASTWS